MKRIALAVALIVMAAGACQRAEDRGTAADSARADTTADTTRMAPDTARMAPDTARARRP